MYSGFCEWYHRLVLFVSLTTMSLPIIAPLVVIYIGLNGTKCQQLGEPQTHNTCTQVLSRDDDKIKCVFGVFPMVPLVSNICTICTKIFTNGTNGKNVTNQW